MSELEEKKLEDEFQIKDELTKAEKKEIKQEVKEILIHEEKVKLDSGIKLELTLEEKISKFFNSIEFLALSDEQKEEVAIKVKEDSAGDKLYWIEIFLSSIIAALGLLQNSVAVVIGAMLIAPLLRPINGLSFSIARGGQKFFVTAFRVLVLSVIASIAMGYIVAVFIGLNIETSEILARSTPNVIDFFIAIFSAMVAVMSLRFTKLGESVAGVAMAASLMPPLAVVGIELAIGNYVASFGAFTLFSANLVAILLVGTIFFWLYGFTPHDSKMQSKVFKRIAIVCVSIIIIMIPLVTSFNSIKTNTEISNSTKNHLTQILYEEHRLNEVGDIQIIKNTKNELRFKIVLKIPEGVYIVDALDKINGSLAKKFNKKVILDLEIIRTINIVSE